jgi:hypothetical protein
MEKDEKIIGLYRTVWDDTLTTLKFYFGLYTFLPGVAVL